MGTIYKVVPILGATFLLTACPPKVKTPEYKPFSIDEILGPLKACTKDEQTQTASAEAAANVFALNDKIPVQDILVKGCDGEEKKRSHGPTRGVYRTLQLKAPKALTGLTFIEVENSRTCTRGAVDLDARTKSVKDVQDSLDGPAVFVAQVTPDGDAYIPVRGIDYRVFTELSVAEGRNVVQVRYYGKCLQYREKRDPKLEESYNCAKPELLATRDFIVQVKTEQVETPGEVVRLDCKR